MIVRRRIYLVTILLVLVFAIVMFTFITQKDTTKEHRGTLVYGYSQEAVVWHEEWLSVC